MVDYNEIIRFKQKIENLYFYFQKAHQEILDLLEDAECFDDEKIDELHSFMKEYEAKLEVLKSDFHLLNSENNKIKSCISQTKLLKKKRVAKLKSNMRLGEDDDDRDLPF